MLRCPTSLSFVAVTAAGPLLCGCVAFAADPVPPAAKKPLDWAGLDTLIAAGDYVKAAARADELAKTAKPKDRDPDFLPRSVERIRVLMRRGLAELRLGRLDEADATFEEAARVFRDADFKRLLAIEKRRANPRTETALVHLDINLVELIELRIAVILARLRMTSLGIDGETTEQAGERADQVGRWLTELEALARSASRARSDLAEGFAKGGPAILASPHYQSLVGEFRPSIDAGVTILELDRLEAVGLRPAVGPEGPSTTTGANVAEARRLFQEASAALDAAIAAAAPKGIEAMKPDARGEAALLRAELLVCEGQALLQAGDPGGGRERFTDALKLQQEAATLRRIPRPEAHPDRFVPSLLAVESMLDEARHMLRAGDSSGARDMIGKAAGVLTSANDLAVPDDHPLRAWLAALQSRLAKDLATVKSAIPGMDAADAAARRVRRALARTAASDAGTIP